MAHTQATPAKYGICVCLCTMHINPLTFLDFVYFNFDGICCGKYDWNVMKNESVRMYWRTCIHRLLSVHRRIPSRMYYNVLYASYLSNLSFALTSPHLLTSSSLTHARGKHGKIYVQKKSAEEKRKVTKYVWAFAGIRNPRVWLNYSNTFHTYARHKRTISVHIRSAWVGLFFACASNGAHSTADIIHIHMHITTRSNTAKKCVPICGLHVFVGSPSHPFSTTCEFISRYYSVRLTDVPFAAIKWFPFLCSSFRYFITFHI